MHIKFSDFRVIRFLDVESIEFCDIFISERIIWFSYLRENLWLFFRSLDIVFHTIYVGRQLFRKMMQVFFALRYNIVTQVSVITFNVSRQMEMAGK